MNPNKVMPILSILFLLGIGFFMYQYVRDMDEIKANYYPAEDFPMRYYPTEKELAKQGDRETVLEALPAGTISIYTDPTIKAQYIVFRTDDKVGVCPRYDRDGTIHVKSDSAGKEHAGQGDSETIPKDLPEDAILAYTDPEIGIQYIVYHRDNKIDIRPRYNIDGTLYIN